jgi:hypothetical protein
MSACHFEPNAVYWNKIGRMSLPFSVRAHLTTTIGGFSFSMHWMNPSFSSSFKRIDKTFGVKPGIESRIRLNLSTPRIPMSLSTSNVHFFPNTPKLALIGHWAKFTPGRSHSENRVRYCFSSENDFCNYTSAPLLINMLYLVYIHVNKDKPRSLQWFAPAIVIITVVFITFAIFIPQFQSVSSSLSSANVTGENSNLKYSDGIAAARTMLAIEGNATALQSRLPSGWELMPYAGEDLRGTSLTGANMLVPFHEVYAVRSHDSKVVDQQQLSYVAFVSQARNNATGEVAHIHWFTYTEDPTDVPGKYKDAKLANVTRSQTFTKERQGETHVRETFDAVARGGEIHLSLGYEQGGMVMWVTADEPNLPFYAARDTNIVRVYQEDQVINVVRSLPMNVDRVSDISLDVKGELEDVFDGTERVIAVVIQHPYMRDVYVPEGRLE